MTETAGQEREPVEHSLLIEPIFQTKWWFLRRRRDYPIQNQPFELGLRAKNLGDRVFPGATLRNIQFRSELLSMTHTVRKEFGTGSLNPGDENEIWVDKMTTHLEGSVWMECYVVPESKDYTVKTFQHDRLTGVLEPYARGPNRWGDASFVQGQMEVQQVRTNRLLVVLASLALLEGLIGLKAIALAVLRAIGAVFLWLGELVGKLVG